MENMTNKKSPRLRVVFGDVVLGVRGEEFEYLFSYQAGGMESLSAGGREWLYRPPMPTFWRASTENDKGNGFPFASAQWMGADQFVKTEEIRIALDGSPVEDFRAPGNNRFGGEVEGEELSVTYTYRTATTPDTKVEVSYRVFADGRIRVDVHYYGRNGLPQLPVFGLRFLLPAAAAGYEYEGLSGETYPDRMDGGVRGTWREQGLPVTPYLVPQDCGVHMGTERLTVFGPGERGGALTVEMEGRPFAFTCLPYTALELESALHQEELPPIRRTVLCILGAVRGVGGIDSWGSDVGREYQIDASRDIEYSFWLSARSTARPSV